MKRILFALFLLVSAAPLFATDDGGDPGYIPDYKELVREGYGPKQTERPQDSVQVNYYSPNFLKAVPIPTQAFYMRGATIYYGYQTVTVWEKDQDTLYAFGHPLSYYQHLMSGPVADMDLSRYAQQVPSNNYQYEPGSSVAQARSDHANAVTRVERVRTTHTTTATPIVAAPNFRTSGVLPPIAEKPR